MDAELQNVLYERPQSTEQDSRQPYRSAARRAFSLAFSITQHFPRMG